MLNQSIRERKEAYVEVLEVLRQMDKKYVAKIPLELREFYERNASKEYEFHIDSSIPLEEYRLKEITINILAILNLNYWCESEEHKQELLKKYHENDIKREEELSNKYNVDNLFKRKEKDIIREIKEEKDVLPQRYKELKWYQKTYNVILKFIKKIFS